VWGWFGFRQRFWVRWIKVGFGFGFEGVLRFSRLEERLR
jgi:hypothetical protein